MRAGYIFNGQVKNVAVHIYNLIMQNTPNLFLSGQITARIPAVLRYKGIKEVIKKFY